MELFLTEDVLLRLSFLKGVACGREDGKVTGQRVGYPALTSQRYFSVERHLLSITGEKMLQASKYSDALPISVKVPGK